MRAIDSRTIGRLIRSLQRPASDRTGRLATGRLIIVLAAILLAALSATTGCGYTVLERSPASEPPPPQRDADGNLILPPGHPPIDEAQPQWRDEDWEGRSFLDHIVGESDPLRFENVRGAKGIRAPSQHAQITLRMRAGGPAVSDVWQIRLDEFGWVTVSKWVQPSSGPQLDEDHAALREEFRLEQESEAALRLMLISMLPISETRARRVPEIKLLGMPDEFWPYPEPGLMELDYRIEVLDALRSDEWPRGTAQAPLDIIEVLIGTWDTAPPPELVMLVRDAVSLHPLLVDLAMIVEGLVLAWEVEGPGAESPLELPLRVGR